MNLYQDPRFAITYNLSVDESTHNVAAYFSQSGSLFYQCSIHIPNDMAETLTIAELYKVVRERLQTEQDLGVIDQYALEHRTSFKSTR